MLRNGIRSSISIKNSFAGTRFRLSSKRTMQQTSVRQVSVLSEAYESHPDMKVLKQYETTMKQMEELRENVFDTAHRAELDKWCEVHAAKTESLKLSKPEFEKSIQDSIDFLTKYQASLSQDNPLLFSGNESTNTPAAAIMFSKFKLMDNQQYFDLLDKDNDGKIEAQEIISGYKALTSNSFEDWMKYEFNVFDKDQDGALTQEETAQMLAHVTGVYKAYLKEVLATQCDKMTKKHHKEFQKAIIETGWVEKLPEKMRCVWHFAEKKSVNGVDTITWESFSASQAAEMPELATLLTVYSKGYYNARYEHYVQRRDTWRTRILGVAFTITAGIADYFIKTVPLTTIPYSLSQIIYNSAMEKQELSDDELIDEFDGDDANDNFNNILEQNTAHFKFPNTAAVPAGKNSADVSNATTTITNRASVSTAHNFDILKPSLDRASKSSNTSNTVTTSQLSSSLYPTLSQSPQQPIVAVLPAQPTATLPAAPNPPLVTERQMLLDEKVAKQVETLVKEETHVVEDMTNRLNYIQKVLEGNTPRQVARRSERNLAHAEKVAERSALREKLRSKKQSS